MQKIFWSDQWQKLFLIVLLFLHPGSIHSSNYPNPYNSNDDCSWTIEVAENHRVQFNFVDFDVEPHANCSYDYVALYDGTSENDPKIIQHCGQNLPTPTATFYATGNKMFIRMKVKNFQFC